MKDLIFAAAIVIAVANSAAHAQPFPGAEAATQLRGEISLPEAASAMLDYHPRLRSFSIRQESLRGQRDQAGLDPAFRIQAGVEEVFGTGDLSGIANAEASISLSRVIELGEKRQSRVGVVNRRIDELHAEQRIAEIDLIAQLVDRFIEVSAAQERLRLQRQSSELNSQILDVLQPLVEAGRAPELELIRARAAMIRARTAESAAEAVLEGARLRLSNLWGENQAQFTGVDTDLFAVGNVGSIEALLGSLSKNPDLELYATETRLRQAELRLARSLRQADIEWSAGLRHLREVDDTGLVFTVSMPLGSKSRAQGNIRQARADLQEVELRRLDTLNRITAEIRALHLQLLQVVDAVNTLEQEVVPLLEEVTTRTRAAYDSGSYSYADLVLAQEEYLDARLALINQAANAHQLRAEIERLSGQALLSPGEQQ